MTWRGGEWHYLRLLAQSVGVWRYKPGGVGSNHDALMTYTLNVKAKSLITSALKPDCDFDSCVCV